MVLQAFALLLAFSTRKVKVKGLNDAKYTAAAIYITSPVSAVIIVSIYSLKEFLNALVILRCTGFIVGTTLILGLVFVPKVWYVAMWPVCYKIRFITDARLAFIVQEYSTKTY